MSVSALSSYVGRLTRSCLKGAGLDLDTYLSLFTGSSSTASVSVAVSTSASSPPSSGAENPAELVLQDYNFANEAQSGSFSEALEMQRFPLGQPGPEEVDGRSVSEDLGVAKAAAHAAGLTTFLSHKTFTFVPAPCSDKPLTPEFDLNPVPSKRGRAPSVTASLRPAKMCKKAPKSRKKTPARIAKEKAKKADKQRKQRQLVTPRTFKFRPAAQFRQATELIVDFDASDMKASKGGYESARMPQRLVIPKEDLTLEGLRNNPEIQVFEWDGVTPVLVLDRNRRPLANLDGRPSLPPIPCRDRWMEDTINPAFELMESISARLSTRQPTSTRGQYIALGAGLSHGGGRGVPGNMLNGSDEYNAAAQQLRSAPMFEQIAGFHSQRLALWFPKGFMYALAITEAVIEHAAKFGVLLTRAFRTSVFPSATWNLPPVAVTVPHRDGTNTPCFHCAITALGRFNPDTSAYLVLYELRLAVRFPSGSSVRICSGNVTHYNTAVGEDEVRGSFTQYMAGGLGRYVAYGFKNEVDLSPIERIFHTANIANAWRLALSLFSTLETVQQDRTALISS